MKWGGNAGSRGARVDDESSMCLTEPLRVERKRVSQSVVSDEREGILGRAACGMIRIRWCSHILKFLEEQGPGVWAGLRQ